MIQSNNIVPSITNKREENKLYFENRKKIKNLIKNINTCLDNNSSTFFLTLFYMDLIFENYSIDEILKENLSIFDLPIDNNYTLNNYVLLSLACLVIASKFNEKDPHVPDLNSFLRLYNQYTKFYFIFSLNELMRAEVNVLKILKYKLNYYSLYQFITFFFSNGILFEKNMKDSDLMRKYKYSEKRVLEKIYVKSREILDLILDDYEQYYHLFNGPDNYVTAIEILIWSIENILNIQIVNDFNYCFPLAYNINIIYSKHVDIYSVIYTVLSKSENLNTNANINISSNIRKPLASSVINNYNFNYGNYFADSQIDIEEKLNKTKINQDSQSNHKNIYLMSVSNSIINNNLEDNFKKQRITSESKNNKSKAYFLKNKDKNVSDNKENNNEYFDQINEIYRMNSISNELDSRISYNLLHDIIGNKVIKSNDIQSMNIINNIKDNNPYKNSYKEPKKHKNNKNKLLKSDLSRNLTSKLNFNFNYLKNGEIAEEKKDYQSYMRNVNMHKNMIKPSNNYNEINPYSSKKNYEKKNSYSNNSLSKKNKTANKRNLNIEYNNSSKTTFYKSWFNNTNPSPNDILNKTKKIIDEANQRIIDFNEVNNADESSNIIANENMNKKDYNDYKFLNENSSHKYFGHRNRNNNELNSNLSDSNIVYKIKNDYLNNKINKYKEEKRNKEKTIIINNNIQINNYVDKENNFSNYYNTSMQDMNDIENMNLENYINKKYFNFNYNKNNNTKNIYLDHINYNNKIIKEKNKKKYNPKKYNYIDENIENLKVNKNISNNFGINMKKSKDNFKLNKDKSNRVLNFGKFHTYFDYSSYDQKDTDYSHINFNMI